MSQANLTVELDTDIVKRTIIDQNGTEITKRYIEKIVNIPTKVKVPLYINNEIISEQKLAQLGLSIKEYTRLEVETELYVGYYEMNPTLAERVKQYKGILDNYGLSYSSTSDEITNVINSDQTLSSQQKTMLGAKLLTLIHDIEINYQEVTGMGLSAWSNISKLIKYLPEE